MSRDEKSKTSKEPVKTEKSSASTADNSQPKIFCHIHDEVGSWVKDKIRQDVCVPAGEYELKEFEGKHYCLFHFPSKNKDGDKFNEIFYDRLDKTDKRCAEIEAEFPNDEEKQTEAKRERNINYNFHYVYFPQGVYLRNRKFTAAADFSSATFSAAADFISAAFTDYASFISAKFSKKSRTNFDETKFGGDTYFDRTRFRNKTSFNSAIFESESDVFFRGTFFAGDADFRYCTAENYLRFAKLRQGNENRFDFEEASFEKAKRISFHTCRLNPNWFVNVDSRKFVFTDVTWKNYEWKPERTLTEKLRFAFDCLKSGFRQLFFSDEEVLNSGIKAELEFLEKRGITEQKKRLLEVACRQLAVNAEENNRYGQASKFRYMAMETKRLQNKGIWRFLNMHWFYKWSSGYGESWSRAALVLILILFFCGAFYNLPFAYFEPFEKKTEKQKEQENISENVEQPKYYKMNDSEGFIHSLYVAALQRPEPKPAADSNLTKAVIIFETIFAPLQAALLALAIRRKFMR